MWNGGAEKCWIRSRDAGDAGYGAVAPEDAQDGAIAPGDAGYGMLSSGALLRSDALDEALRYFAILMSSMLPSLWEGSQLYTLMDEKLGYWVEVTKCHLERGRLPVLFYKVLFEGNGSVGINKFTTAHYPGG